MEPITTIETFCKSDIRVGRITHAEVLAKAKKPAYKLSIDFGPEIGTKKSSAQLTTRYVPEDLVGKQVLAVVNFAPRQIADFISECLVLGAVGNDGDVVLIQPEFEVANGLRIA
jgi:tRNA-binding protein